MSIATRVDFFLHVGNQDARDDSVVGMPESTVLHTVLRLTLHLCMRFFSVADPLAGGPCPSFLRLTSPYPPWPSVRWRARSFLLLGPHELDC